MACLPLSAGRTPGEGTYMYVTGGIRRLAQVAGEMNDAVRRMTELRLARDLGQGTPSDPDELLLRGAGRLVHEPSAMERSAGERVR